MISASLLLLLNKLLKLILLKPLHFLSMPSLQSLKLHCLSKNIFFNIYYIYTLNCLTFRMQLKILPFN